MTDSEVARLERALERAADKTATALASLTGAVGDLRVQVVAIDTRAEERLRRCENHSERLKALEVLDHRTPPDPPRLTLDQASMRVLLYILGALVLGGGAGASGWAAMFGGGGGG